MGYSTTTTTMSSLLIVLTIFVSATVAGGNCNINVTELDQALDIRSRNWLGESPTVCFDARAAGVSPTEMIETTAFVTGYNNASDPLCIAVLTDVHALVGSSY